MQPSIINDPFSGMQTHVTRSENNDIILRSPHGGYIFMKYNSKEHSYEIPAQFIDTPIELLTLDETRKILNVSSQAISHLAVYGKIKCILIGNTCYYPKTDVLEYKKSRKRGRPPKE